MKTLDLSHAILDEISEHLKKDRSLPVQASELNFVAGTLSLKLKTIAREIMERRIRLDQRNY